MVKIFFSFIFIILFSGCSDLFNYKSCTFQGECYSINETDRDKAVEQCINIAEKNGKGYFVLVQVSPEACN